MSNDTATEYLTTAEVAKRLRTAPETVRYWRHIGKGPKSFKIGRRVLYAEEDVQSFITDTRAEQNDLAAQPIRTAGARSTKQAQEEGMLPARQALLDAANDALQSSYNGMNEFQDALCEWWRAEADAVVQTPHGVVRVYDHPAMADTPAVKAARAYLRGDR